MGNIVADSIAEDVVQGVSQGDVECFAADDDDQFAFVVDAGNLEGGRVDRYGIGRAGEGGDWFVEEDGVFWQGQFGLQRFSVWANRSKWKEKTSLACCS